MRFYNQETIVEEEETLEEEETEEETETEAGEEWHAVPRLIRRGLFFEFFTVLGLDKGLWRWHNKGIRRLIEL